MSSAFQSIGSGLTNWGMPNAGSFISDLPYVAGNFFGGGGGGFGPTGAGAMPAPPTDQPPDSTTAAYAAAMPSPPPTPLGTGGAAMPSTSGSLPAVPSSGSVIPASTTTPAPAFTAPSSTTNLTPTNYASSVQTGQAGTPDPSLWQQVQAYFSNPKNWGTIIGGGADIGEMINRWMVQRQLQNPSALMGGASKLFQGMSKAAKRAIIGPVRAEAQETGQINAPLLYAQSVATALGPYQYQMQMQALADYINALEASGSAYPSGGGYGLGGPYPAGGAPIYQGGAAMNQ